MFFLFIIFTCYSCIFFSLGNILIKLFDKKKYLQYNFIDRIILGIFVLTFFAFVFHFFVPLNGILFFIFLIPSLLYTSWYVKNHYIRKRWKVFHLFILSLTALVLLYIFSFIVDSGDGRYYHMQFVESIYRFPIIKGLANLEDRYGFDSSVFLLNSLLGFKFYLGFHYFGLNAYLFFILLLASVHHLLIKITPLSLSVLCALLLYYALFINYANTNITSSSNDIFVTLLGFYLLSRILTLREHIIDLPLIFIFVPLLMLTIKLGSLFFSLFSLIVLFQLIKRKKYPQILIISIFSALFIGLWFTRNVFISGYLIYPYFQIDLFDVDWKVPALVAKIQTHYIKDYGYFTVINDYRLIQLGQLLTKSYIYPIFAFGFIVLPFLFLYLFMNIKHKIILFLCSLILTFGYLFVMYQAPDIRFSVLYLLGIFLIVLYIVFGYNSIYRYSLIIFFTFFIYSSYSYLESNKSFLNKVFFKPQLTQKRINTEPKEYVRINNYTIDVINTDSYSFFGYESFPLSSYTGFPIEVLRGNPAQSFKIQHLKTIEMRGEKITDGFRTIDKWKIYFEENEETLIKDYQNDIRERLLITPR